MLCAICYHLYNLKDMKKHPWKDAPFSRVLKVALLHACFSRFLNCTNGTESCNPSETIILDEKM